MTRRVIITLFLFIIANVGVASSANAEATMCFLCDIRGGFQSCKREDILGAACQQIACLKSELCRQFVPLIEEQCWQCTDEGKTFCHPDSAEQPTKAVGGAYQTFCNKVRCVDEPACGLIEKAIKNYQPATVEFTPNVTIPGTEFQAGKTVTLNPALLPTYLAGIYQLFIVFGVLLALIVMMVGGYQWIVAAGSPERIKSAQKMLGNAIVGLIFLLVSHTIMVTINPKLVNLEAFGVPWVQRINIAVKETENVDGGPATGAGSGEEVRGVPLFKQSNSAWHSINLGACPVAEGETPPTYAYAGCGPSSVAMVLKKYGDNAMTPVKAGNAIVRSGNRVCGSGTDVAGFVQARRLGHSINKSNVDDVLGHLKNGNPIIAHVGCIRYGTVDGKRTCVEKWQGKYSGHYVVLTEYDEAAGIIYVNDPAGADIKQITKADLEKGIMRFIYINPTARIE